MIWFIVHNSSHFDPLHLAGMLHILNPPLTRMFPSLSFEVCLNRGIHKIRGYVKILQIITTLYHHIPIYRTPNLTEHHHRISITARKHTDFEIDSIPISHKNHTVNGIILLHKFFLLKKFFLTSFLCCCLHGILY